MGSPGHALYERLLAVLSQFGSRTMAKSALDRSLDRLGLPAGWLSPRDLERVSEEAMNSFRMFCSDEQRQALWIELVEFICEEEGR